MIPQKHEYLSFLMGAPAISDEELQLLGIEIIEGTGGNTRKLLIPYSALDLYKALIKQHLQPGYWNETVGQSTVDFIFKMSDGIVKELIYTPENCEEIARLCSKINGDPIEKTSNVLQYLATNSFYRDTLIERHGITPE